MGFAPLAARGMMQIVNGSVSLCPGVSFQLARGHTPGSQVVRIEGVGAKGEKRVAVIMGDLIHSTLEVEHPDWSPIWDLEPEVSAKNRKDLLELISDEGALMIAGHFPFPG